MLGSLLPSRFFRLPNSTVSKPITVTPASVKLLHGSDAPSHVLLTLMFTSVPLIFIPFFFKLLPVFFPAWVFCYLLLLCNWSFHLSFKYMSLFAPCLCVCCCCLSSDPNTIYSFWKIMGSSPLLLLHLGQVTLKFTLNSIGIKIDRYGHRFYVYMHICK